MFKLPSMLQRSTICWKAHRNFQKCLQKNLIGITNQRNFSSTNEHISVSKVEGGIATLVMQRSPVNSMNMEFLQQFISTIKHLEAQKDCRGVIVSSSLSKVFCAGLDIMEMYKPKIDRLTQFWTTFQEFFKTLYGSPLITFAAINGHAPAGGCMMSICCDYRIMVNSSASIGLNETMLGITAPLWLAEVFAKTVGNRQAEKLLFLGKRLLPEEALRTGVVDELVADSKELIDRSKVEMSQWMKIPDPPRRLTKQLLRQQTIENLKSYQEEETKNVAKLIMSDKTQEIIKLYLESLKKK